MKITVPSAKEIEITHVLIDVPVRYDEEDIPNDFPLRQGNRWRGTVDIDTGKIKEWPAGKSGDIEFMKVCDSGSYALLDAQGNAVAKLENDYVPNNLIPPDDGYGDYISLFIDEAGVVTNWPKRPDVSQFFPKND